MTNESIITLSIDDIGLSPQNIFQIFISFEDTIIEKNVLSINDSQDVLEIGMQYNKMLEQHYPDEIPTQTLEALGRRLNKLSLANSWIEIKNRIPLNSFIIIVIASDVPEILNLPWELLLPDDDHKECEFLALHPLFGIRRHPSPATKIPEFDGSLRPNPLRLLFMACAPANNPALYYELEEEVLLKAISGFDVVYSSADMGTFEELRDLVNKFQPHIIHLTGHAVMRKKCIKCNWLNGSTRTRCKKCRTSLEAVYPSVYFAFEDEKGFADFRSSSDISRMLAGRGIQCIFFSGCYTGKNPPENVYGGICQGIVSKGIPMALGWASSIADSVATKFIRAFYKAIASGQTIDKALFDARCDIWEMCKKQENLSWILPVLYSSSSQGKIFEPITKTNATYAIDRGTFYQAVPGMKESHAEYFVGRRREIQQLLSALRDGCLHILIITGFSGIGKRALADRLARKIEVDKYILIHMPSETGSPLTVDSILEISSNKIRKAARIYQSDELKAIADDLINPKIPKKALLNDLIDAFNIGRFLLILDNFDLNLGEQNHQIISPELSEFYKNMLLNLSGNSRLIITSRFVPKDLPKLPPKAKTIILSDLSEGSFIKILRRYNALDQRYRSGELSINQIQKLYNYFGGIPGFLIQMFDSISNMDTSEMIKEINLIDSFAESAHGKLQDIYMNYLDKSSVYLLYDRLSYESKANLSKFSVFRVPMSYEGMKVATSEPSNKLSELVAEWEDIGFVYPTRVGGISNLWTAYGLLRTWLKTRISKEDLIETNKMVAEFLYNLFKKSGENLIGLSPKRILIEAQEHYIGAGSQCETQCNLVAGIIQYFDAEKENALQSLTQAISRDKFNSDAYYFRGTIYNELGKKFYSLSKEDLLKATELDRDNPEKHASLARIYHGLGELELAKNEEEQALKLGKISNESEVQMILGNSSLRMRRYDDAVKIYKACSPNHTPAIIKVCEALFKKANDLATEDEKHCIYNDVIIYLDQAIERNSTSYAYYTYRGKAFAARNEPGDWEKALQDWDLARNKNAKDNNIGRFQGDAFFNRAIKLEKCPEREELLRNAIKCYQEASDLALGWFKPVFLNKQSSVYQLLGEYDKALETAKRGINLARVYHNEYVQNYISWASAAIAAHKWNEAINAASQGLQCSEQQKKTSKGGKILCLVYRIIGKCGDAQSLQDILPDYSCLILELHTNREFRWIDIIDLNEKLASVLNGWPEKINILVKDSIKLINRELNPIDAWTNSMKNFEEDIKFNLMSAETWNNLGIILKNKECKSQSEDAFDKSRLSNSSI